MFLLNFGKHLVGVEYAALSAACYVLAVTVDGVAKGLVEFVEKF